MRAPLAHLERHSPTTREHRSTGRWYLLARRFGPLGFAAALAALTMLYPADASHLWLGP